MRKAKKRRMPETKVAAASPVKALVMSSLMLSMQDALGLPSETGLPQKNGAGWQIPAQSNSSSKKSIQLEISWKLDYSLNPVAKPWNLGLASSLSSSKMHCL